MHPDWYKGQMLLNCWSWAEEPMPNDHIKVATRRVQTELLKTHRLQACYPIPHYTDVLFQCTYDWAINAASCLTLHHLLGCSLLQSARYTTRWKMLGRLRAASTRHAPLTMLM